MWHRKLELEITQLLGSVSLWLRETMKSLVDHRNDGERDLHMRKVGASAALILDVAVQEVVVPDVMRVASWSQLGEHEHLLWSSGHHFVRVEESTPLLLLFLGVHMILDSAKLKAHLQTFLLWAMRRHSLVVLVLKNCKIKSVVAVVSL